MTVITAGMNQANHAMVNRMMISLTMKILKMIFTTTKKMMITGHSADVAINASMIMIPITIMTKITMMIMMIMTMVIAVKAAGVWPQWVAVMTMITIAVHHKDQDQDAADLHPWIRNVKEK
jgi:hypothetical protein